MLDPQVLYEDRDVLVIDKPAGLVVHPDGKNQEPTLVDWILAKYPEIKDVGEPLIIGEQTFYRPGIVHRLDKDTSGVMVIAKSQKSYEFLKKQFSARGGPASGGQVSHPVKKYLALVWGKFNEESGVINKPIGKSAKDFRLRSAEYGARGELREAETHWQVIESFGEYTLLSVTPKTGRTHQIRVHMKAIGHPVVCDKLYAPNKACPTGGLARQALHAESLRIKLPGGEGREFHAPIPEDLKSLLDELRSV